MSKWKKWVLLPILLVIAFFVSSFAYEWLLSIDANDTLLFFIPTIVFISVSMGLWLVFSLIETFFLHTKGMAGYKIRGKMTFYFFLTNLISIGIVGGVMFVLIMLIESAIIDKEKGVADFMLDAYKDMIIHNKREFEREMDQRAQKTPKSFRVIFYFTNDAIVYEREIDAEIKKVIAEQVNNINIFYKRSNKRFLYPGDVATIAILKENDKCYAEWIPEHLQLGFDRANKSMDSLYSLKVLKEYIRPISIVSVLVLAVPILIGVIFISRFVAKNISANIEIITKGTNIIAMGNLDYKVNIETKDEFEDLANNFNAMAVKLKIAAQQVKRMERLEAWKEMAKRLAHEIKNPLTPIKLSAERLIYAYDNKREDFNLVLDKTTATIVSETKRLENLVNEFSQYARLPYPKLENRNMLSTVNAVVDFFKNAYPKLDIFQDSEETEFMLEYDEGQMKQVLINLIKNSIEACREGVPTVRISLRREYTQAIITIADTSGGIDIEVKDKIFEPYYTTKAGGNGLGLAIAERIVLEHNGLLWFESDETGTEFFIELPMKNAGEKNEV